MECLTSVFAARLAVGPFCAAVLVDNVCRRAASESGVSCATRFFVQVFFAVGCGNTCSDGLRHSTANGWIDRFGNWCPRLTCAPSKRIDEGPDFIASVHMLCRENNARSQPISIQCQPGNMSALNNVIPHLFPPRRCNANSTSRR